MSTSGVERPDLPEYPTWEELGQLPEELAAQIELWDGRVVWVRRGPFEHQQYTGTFWSAPLRRNARERAMLFAPGRYDSPPRALLAGGHGNEYLLEGE